MLEGCGFAERPPLTTRVLVRPRRSIPKITDTFQHRYFTLLKKVLVLLKAYKNPHQFKLKRQVGTLASDTSFSN